MTDRILLITTTPSIASQVAAACQELDAELVHERTVESASAHLRRAPHLVVCDYDVFVELRRHEPRASALLYAAPGASEQAIEAIKHGAIDYLVTPLHLPDLVGHLRDALRISHDVQVPAVYEEARDDTRVEQIIGQSPAMRAVYKMVGRVAPRDVNVLITGESGTGKELVARAILHHSQRKSRPYVAINCAAIPETLLEAELFGHEKGAFTGADRQRIGKFEQCHEGTLFLDEIGDIPIATQAKLLRMLQEGVIQRLGGSTDIHCDVRILAATHQSLETLIAQRAFREDLYYRLNVATIHMPPLREREVDVVLIAHHLVRHYNARFGTHIQSFAPETLPILLSYHWPGNVRELDNAIKAALVVAQGSVLRPEFLPASIRGGSPHGVPPGSARPHDTLRGVVAQLIAQPDASGSTHARAIALVEAELIRQGLERTGGRLTRTAELLGISRTTLRNKIAAHGIQTRTTVDRPGEST